MTAGAARSCAAALLAVAALSACADASSEFELPGRPRALLLGIDGADWSVIDPLMRAGYLPQLGALVSSGVRADLDCAPAMPETACFCPPVWVSIVTGVSRERHRIAAIHDPVSLRKAATLWDVMYANDRTTSAISFRNTWRPEPALRFVLTEPGLDYAAGQIYALWPERLSVRVRDATSRTKPPGLFEKLELLPAEGERRAVQAILGRDRLAMEATLRLVTTRPTDLTVILLHSPDKAQHLKWGSVQAEPGGPFDEAALLAQAEQWDGPIFAESRDHQETVASQYLEIDAWLARLFAATSFDYVLVASDHGMTRSPVGLAGGHGPDLPDSHEGVFALSGPGVRAGVRLEKLSVFDVAPTLAYVLDMPVARDLDGRVVEEAFEAAFARLRPLRRIDTWPKGSARRRGRP